MNDLHLVFAWITAIGVSFYAKRLREKLDDAEEFRAGVERIRTRCREMNNTPASREWAYDELLTLLDL